MVHKASQLEYLVNSTVKETAVKWARLHLHRASASSRNLRTSVTLPKCPFHQEFAFYSLLNNWENELCPSFKYL